MVLSAESIEILNSFIEEDPAFKNAIANASTAEEIQSLFSSKGLSMSIEEAENALKNGHDKSYFADCEISDELGENELDAVAGGVIGVGTAIFAVATLYGAVCVGAFIIGAATEDPAIKSLASKVKNKLKKRK